MSDNAATLFLKTPSLLLSLSLDFGLKIHFQKLLQIKMCPANYTILTITGAVFLQTKRHPVDQPIQVT